MITLLLIIPLIGSLILLPMSETAPQGTFSLSTSNLTGEKISITDDENKNSMKKIALTTSLINFFVSLFLWYEFDSSSTQYQFISEFNQLNFCHLNFGVDGISLYFVLLTTFITPIALLSNYTNITNNLKFF